jgi:hypothetical protein
VIPRKFHHVQELLFEWLPPLALGDITLGYTH